MFDVDASAAFEALAPLAITWGLRVLGALFGLWLAFRVANWLQKRFVAMLRTREMDEALTVFFGNVLKYLVLTAAIIAIFGVFGLETTTFAAVLGAAGLAVGLAFQGTLSNFAAGVMILTFRPFDIGDYVKVAGQEGTVREIGIFVVVLDTLDNRKIIIGNSEAIGGTIENLTTNPLRRVDIDVATHVAADVDATLAVLEEAAAGVPNRDPEAGHQIFLAGFGDACMQWQVRVWCQPEHYWDVWHDTVLHTKRALVAANMSAPYGKLTVELQRDAA